MFLSLRHTFSVLAARPDISCRCCKLQKQQLTAIHLPVNLYSTGSAALCVTCTPSPERADRLMGDWKEERTSLLLTGQSVHLDNSRLQPNWALFRFVLKLRVPLTKKATE